MFQASAKYGLSILMHVADTRYLLTHYKLKHRKWRFHVPLSVRVEMQRGADWWGMGFKKLEVPGGVAWATDDPRVADRMRAQADGETKRLLDSLFIRTNPVVSDPPFSFLTGGALFPYQVEAVKFALARNRCYLAADPGTGKTLMALAVMMTLKRSAVYVCPPALIENVRAEIAKWWPTVRVRTLDDVQHEGYVRSEPCWTVLVVPDNSARWVETPFSIKLFVQAEGAFGRRVMLIGDEAHRFKEPRSARSKWFYRDVVRLFDRVLLMSGTPMPNRPRELFLPISRMAPEVIDFKNFHEYGVKYCAARRGRWGWEYKGESNLEELRAGMKLFMHRVDKRKLIASGQLPARQESAVVLGRDLNPRLVEMERGELKELSPEDLMREQFGNPCVATYRRLLGEFKAPFAADYIRYLLSSTDEKLVVFAVHKDTIRILRERLSFFDPLVITGDTPVGARKKIVDEFCNSERQLFIGNVQAAGTGFNMQAAHRVIFVETPWTPGDIDQAIDRTHRVGQTQNVYVQHLVFQNSIDRKVVDAVLRKRENISTLYDEKGSMMGGKLTLNINVSKESEEYLAQFTALCERADALCAKLCDKTGDTFIPCPALEGDASESDAPEERTKGKGRGRPKGAKGKKTASGKSGTPTVESAFLEEDEPAAVETAGAEEAGKDDLFSDEDLGIREPEGPSREETLDILKRFREKHGKEKTLKVLNKFGVKSFNALTVEKYGDVVALAGKYL